MKKGPLMIFMTLLLFSACKKNSNDQGQDPNLPGTDPSSGVSEVLLSAVINNVKDDPNKGTPVINFSYKGKQLSSVVGYAYTFAYKGAFTQSHVFNYNSSGQLTGTDVTYTNPSDYKGPLQPAIHTAITYTGSNITEVKISDPNNTNVPPSSIIFTYSGSGKLTRISRNEEVYTIDANGNYATLASTVNGAPYSINYTFDTHKNIVGALPHWQYFYIWDFLNTSSFNSKSIVLYNGIFNLIPNVNNVLSSTTNRGSLTSYSYTYDTNGYPSASTVSYNEISEDFSYQYITAN